MVFRAAGMQTNHIVEAASLIERGLPETTAESSHGEQKETSAWIHIVGRKVLMTLAMVATMVALAPTVAKLVTEDSVKEHPHMMSQSATSLIGLSGTGAPPGSTYISRRDEIIKVFNLPEHYLSGGYDWSYPAKSDGETYQRGGIEYHPPWGFDKLALDWSGMTSFLDETQGWHVVYHGTSPKSLRPILRHGLLIKGGQKTAKNGDVYGTGVYCSPYANYAKSYAKPKQVNGVKTYPVLMCRVRPGSYTKKTTSIWLVERVDGIRCFALLFSRG